MKIDMKELKDLVSRPGKYEGEHPLVPYLWGLWACGGGEDVGTDSAGYDLLKFELTPEEIEAFPDVHEKCGNAVYLAEDSQGFVMQRFPDLENEYRDACEVLGIVVSESLGLLEVAAEEIRAQSDKVQAAAERLTKAQKNRGQS